MVHAPEWNDLWEIADEKNENKQKLFFSGICFYFCRSQTIKIDPMTNRFLFNDCRSLALFNIRSLIKKVTQHCTHKSISKTKERGNFAIDRLWTSQLAIKWNKHRVYCRRYSSYLVLLHLIYFTHRPNRMTKARVKLVHHANLAKLASLAHSPLKSPLEQSPRELSPSCPPLLTRASPSHIH